MLINRWKATIATVKTFDAQAYQVSTLSDVLNRMQVFTKVANAGWGFTSALSQFSSMAVVVQCFWFGASLVRKGTVCAGDVMSVF